MLGLPFFKLPFFGFEPKAEQLSQEELERMFIKYLKGLGIGPEEIETAYLHFSKTSTATIDNPKVADIVREMNRFSHYGFQIDRFMEAVAKAKSRSDDMRVDAGWDKE